MGAGPQVRVDGYSRCIRLAPATVETFEKISKLNPPGRREAQPRVLKRDSPGRWRNSNGGGEVCGVVIGGALPLLKQSGEGKLPELGLVYKRQQAPQRKTNSARRIPRHPLLP